MNVPQAHLGGLGQRAAGVAPQEVLVASQGGLKVALTVVMFGGFEVSGLGDLRGLASQGEGEEEAAQEAPEEEPSRC